MESAALAPDRLTEAPAPMFKVPVPLGVSAPLAVLGLMNNDAVLPVALMLALILTLFEAVSVSAVLALQETVSLTLTLPLPALAPALLCSVMEVVPSSLESVAPVISPPLGATLKSFGSMSQLP